HRIICGGGYIFEKHFLRPDPPMTHRPAATTGLTAAICLSSSGTARRKSNMTIHTGGFNIFLAPYRVDGHLDQTKTAQTTIKLYTGHKAIIKNKSLWLVEPQARAYKRTSAVPPDNSPVWTASDVPYENIVA